MQAASKRIVADGCRYAVADIRIPSYNGSIGFEQEKRMQKPEFKQAIDKYASKSEKLVPVEAKDVSNLLLDPTANLYHRLANMQFLWIAKDFIPQDKPSGGFRIIGYVDLTKEYKALHPHMTLSEEWALISEATYGPEFIAELAALLKENGIKNVLECGCGSGHVLEGLSQQGFECIGIDLDSELIALASKRNNSNFKSFLLDWLKLDKLKGEFDAVICRGNSLSSAVSWNKTGIDSEEAGRAITKSLKLMYQKLKPGGLLYLDTASNKEVDRNGGDIEFVNREDYLKGKIEYDWKKRIRKMSGGGVIAGQEFEGESYSYLIKPNELIQLIEKFEFRKIWQPVLSHEVMYDIICALKKT